MINDQLITLCRTIVAAIQESDGLDANQLRKLFLRVVPQLLSEIEILGNLLQSPFALAPQEPDPLPMKAGQEQEARKAARKPAAKKSRRRRK